MHVGKLVFAQVMDHLPWKTFDCIVERYGGDHRVREFSCANQFAVWRLRNSRLARACNDIAASLRAQSAKLYHLVWSALIRSAPSGLPSVRAATA
jgi:hypothetical protein